MLKHVVFAATPHAIVVHKMFADVYNNTGIGYTRRIVKFLLASVPMHELKVAQSHQHSNRFQWCCHGSPSLRLKLLNMYYYRLTVY
jgi:hypothetical protein